MFRALILTALPAATGGIVTSLSLETTETERPIEAKIVAYAQLEQATVRHTRPVTILGAAPSFVLPVIVESEKELTRISPPVSTSNNVRHQLSAERLNNMTNNLRNGLNNEQKKKQLQQEYRNHKLSNVQWSSNGWRQQANRRTGGYNHMAIDSKSDGTYTEKKGQLTIQYSVVDGEMHGDSRSWTSNGDLYVIESYNKGLLDGRQEMYHSNGQLRSSVSYEQGQATGEATFYSDQGAAVRTVNYG